MRNIAIIFCIIIPLNLIGQDKMVNKIFNSEGSEVSYTDMINTLIESDVTFFGELHSNPISHWMEYEVTASLYEKHKDNLILGAEMFESDGQIILDEYIEGFFSDSKFEADARIWPNYETDYKPLVNFAVEHKLKFIATNIPRRYASIVLSKGFEGLNDLSENAKQYIAPLPIEYDPEIACYANMLNMGNMRMPAHTKTNLPKAQAIKDATMAYFIYKNIKSGTKFIHYQGAYHSDNHEGILIYLRKLNPNLTLKTISTAIQSDVSKLDEENKGIADFIIVVDENLTGSY